MKQRCYNKNNDAYCRYGGRGIVICKEWLDRHVIEQRLYYGWSIERAIFTPIKKRGIM